MIYLVSRNKSLFSPTKYKQIEFSEAMKLLLPLKLAQFDTETMGLDPHTKELLTIQLGCKKFQIVFDWTTLTKAERLQLKAYFESDRVFLGWNLMFDLGFLYVNDIWPRHLWDGMIAEKLIFLGYPPALSVALYNKLNLLEYTPVTDPNTGEIKYYEISYSLRAAAMRRCGIDIDKTVRGKIIDEGLTEEVVVYAAGDVMWLEDIKAEQDKELDRQDLQRAMTFECEFIKPLAYAKHCGVHLDITKWTAKMNSDLARLRNAEKALNDWVVNWEKDRAQSVSPGNEIEYVDPNISPKSDAQWLLDHGYIRYQAGDKPSPMYPGNRLQAYKKKPQKSKYTVKDTQGDLFNGFDPNPRCTINWSSSKQVIPLFEELGIQVKTFDKKTKKEKKSVEEKLLAPQAKDFPIISLYLDYQGASKVVSTYGDNWLKAINPKTGRIHVELHSIGTDTARVSSGGGVYKLNLQNLPHDKETRACFTAEKGNVWISCDYSGQESAITASVSKDAKMIEILSNGGDLHSEVAKSCWPSLLGNLTDEEVKEKYKDYRQNAKGVEFGIFYGGDAHTLHANKGFEMKEAERIYNNFMEAFPGIKQYQDYCRRDVMEKGYILMNPVVGHRAHIFDYSSLKKTMEKMKDRDFMSYYWEMRKSNPYCDTVQEVKEFNARKSASERQAINYRIQNRGACCFKLASIKFFNWIVQNNYQNIVKMCAPVHDEWNIECPKEMQDLVSDTLVKCMIAGGKPFCPNVFLGADISVGDYWIH
nr:MAG TPA: Prex DNA polymerase [Caudoviricetes sp.]